MEINSNCNQIIALEPNKENEYVLIKNIHENHLSEKINVLNIKVNNQKSKLKGKTLNIFENLTNSEIKEQITFIFNRLMSDVKTIDFVRYDIKNFDENIYKEILNKILIFNPKLWLSLDDKNYKNLNAHLNDAGYYLFDYDIGERINLLYVPSNEKFVPVENVFNKIFYYYSQNKSLIDKNIDLKLELDNEKNKNLNLNNDMNEIKNLLELDNEIIYELNNSQVNWDEHYALRNIYINENKLLKNQINRYKSRKVVKITDKLIKISKKIIKNFNINTPQKSVKKLKTESNDLNNTKTQDKIKVAVIMDEFTYNSFKHEFIPIVVEPNNWKVVFETEKPELFFCESVWEGIDTKKKPWNKKIYTGIEFEKENRSILFSILDYCKKNRIPTIFWNKEDPTHFHDLRYNFIDTALRFDYIFTTAEECIELYENKGHSNVYCLPFAGQPKLFNPIKNHDRTDEVIFAGSWYRNHPERSKKMTKIFNTILNQNYALKIYNRAYYLNYKDRIFPKKYQKFIYPPVPFYKIEKIYKESKFSLNINTVENSKTMFARRVFELILCNTMVLSNYSVGMKILFGDNVIFVDTKDDFEIKDSEEKRINNLYIVLENHTYEKRFEQILDTIKFNYRKKNKFVTIYYIANTYSDMKEIIRNYQKIDYSYKKLSIILSENFPKDKIKELHTDYSQKFTLYFEPDLLGKSKLYINKTPYFIFQNSNFERDFVKKAILHYKYISENYGIVNGENNFTFNFTKNPFEVLFPANTFVDVFDSIFNDAEINFPIYKI